MGEPCCTACLLITACLLPTLILPSRSVSQRQQYRQLVNFRIKLSTQQNTRSCILPQETNLDSFWFRPKAKGFEFTVYFHLYLTTESTPGILNLLFHHACKSCSDKPEPVLYNFRPRPLGLPRSFFWHLLIPVPFHFIVPQLQLQLLRLHLRPLSSC